MNRSTGGWTAATACGLASAMLVVAGAACSDGSSESGTDATTSSTTSSAALSLVAFGDSWPQGDHMVDCDGECRPFPVLWAEALETQTGRQIEFSDFTGTQEGGSRSEGKGSATLLEKLRESEPIRDAARNADIILIATGQNEANPGSPTFDALQAGNCGPEFQCVRHLGQMWSENFDAMLTEIDELRDGEPKVVRLVTAAAQFDSPPPPSEVLPSALWLQSELLAAAICDAAAAHDAICVDVRPLFTSAEENTPASMQATADALVATGLPELE